MEMLPLKGCHTVCDGDVALEGGVAHSCNPPPPHLLDMRLADILALCLIRLIFLFIVCDFVSYCSSLCYKWLLTCLKMRLILCCFLFKSLDTLLLDIFF